MERAHDRDLWVFVYSNEACQKYGPFICPSEERELSNCLPKLFEAHDPQVGDSGIRMKTPRWAGERNILIIDRKDDKIIVFAIPATISMSSIQKFLARMTSEDVLRGRTLHALTGESIEDPLDEDDSSNALSGEVSPIQEMALSNFNVLKEPEVFDEVPLEEDPPVIEEDDIAGDENVSRKAELPENSLISPVPCSPQLPIPETADKEERYINKLCTSSSSSEMSISSLFSGVEFPPGQEEDNATRDRPQCIELPTAKEIVDVILKDDVAKEKFKKAHKESYIFRERGGFIFADPNDPENVFVELAPKSASVTFLLGDAVTPSIDLSDIITNNVPPGFNLVGTFHTHPLNFNEEASTADVNNAYYRGIPGIIISRRKIFGYGPERRRNMKEPLKYAPPIDDVKNYKSTKLADNPFLSV